MSRYGDKGPYQVGNVFIQTCSANIAQARKADIGRKDSDETRLKKSLSAKGKTKPPISDQHRQNLKTSHLGIEPSNKGIPDVLVKCPHCNKIGGRSVMKRWHFDNCKL